MAKYRSNSIWSDRLELECLFIMKKAEEKDFPRGLVTELCRQLAQEENIDEGTLKAKVGNYKSLAGHTKTTNASSATRHFFNKYGHCSTESIETIIRDMKNETNV